jgi:hypothetical protein
MRRIDSIGVLVFSEHDIVSKHTQRCALTKHNVRRSFFWPSPVFGFGIETTSGGFACSCPAVSYLRSAESAGDAGDGAEHRSE